MVTPAEIRPIYEELLGYLSEAPDGSNGPVMTYRGVWEASHSTIDELNRTAGAGADYSKFRVDVKSGITNGQVWQQARLDEYRSKLSSLIRRLHAEFFSDEPVRS